MNKTVTSWTDKRSFYFQQRYTALSWTHSGQGFTEHFLTLTAMLFLRETGPRAPAGFLQRGLPEPSSLISASTSCTLLIDTARNKKQLSIYNIPGSYLYFLLIVSNSHPLASYNLYICTCLLVFTFKIINSTTILFYVMRLHFWPKKLPNFNHRLSTR